MCSATETSLSPSVRLPFHHNKHLTRQSRLWAHGTARRCCHRATQCLGYDVMWLYLGTPWSRTSNKLLLLTCFHSTEAYTERLPPHRAIQFLRVRAKHRDCSAELAGAPSRWAQRENAPHEIASDGNMTGSGSACCYKHYAGLRLDLFFGCAFACHLQSIAIHLTHWD